MCGMRLQRIPEILWLYGPVPMSPCREINIASLTGTRHFEYLQLLRIDKDHITWLKL
jgi:hypothetical protein